MEFENDTIKTTSKVSQMLEKAKELDKKRTIRIRELSQLKENLLAEPKKYIELSGVTIPDGIELYEHQKIALTFLK